MAIEIVDLPIKNGDFPWIFPVRFTSTFFHLRPGAGPGAGPAPDPNLARPGEAMTCRKQQRNFTAESVALKK
jgi:hypothetical protein